MISSGMGRMERDAFDFIEDGVARRVCRRLAVPHPRFVEIESKRRVLPDQLKELKRYLAKRKKVVHVERVVFFDQFLDTPKLDLFKRGASLRLRYKRGGTKVALQYKGPGYHRDGLLYRSEFSSNNLGHLIREESHHDMIRFTASSVRQIIFRDADPLMGEVMRRHLGPAVVNTIANGIIVSMYQKDKYLVELGSAFMEPSVDRVLAFHTQRPGLHPLSMFYEYENEIKAPKGDFEAKMEHLDDLLEFERNLQKEFSFPVERLDKYHRCAANFAA